MDEDVAYLITVKHFAFEEHQKKNQLYGESPYNFHLNDVVYNAEKYIDEIQDDSVKLQVIAAAYGHDLLEDCVSYNDILKVFGHIAADIIYDVTNELGKDRDEKAAKTLPKTAKNRLAIYIKCCDRLSNTTYSKNSGSGMYQKYVKEYGVFRSYLRSDGLYPKLWSDLDKINSFISQ